MFPDREGKAVRQDTLPSCVGSKNPIFTKRIIMECYIITGASRGIGRALALEAARGGADLVTLSRSEAADLQAQSRALGVSHTHYSADLSNPALVLELNKALFQALEGKDYRKIILINNAGQLQPVAPCGKAEEAVMVQAMNVNSIAPMILSSGLIRHCKAQGISGSILNISSGAARNPYAGWSAYCSSKAALDMFTACVALEQEQAYPSVRILSLGPGTVDTAMQEAIRDVDPANFPMKAKFIRLHEEQRLTRTDDVARKLMRALASDELPSGTISDLRDLSLV